MNATKKRTNTRQFAPELLEAIKGWSKLPHTELAIACQAMYALATHDDSPQWIRDAASAIADDMAR